MLCLKIKLLATLRECDVCCMAGRWKLGDTLLENGVEI